jgi:hypothetical protein
MPEPCLCGDPGCSRCFGASSAARSRAFDKLQAAMQKADAGCPHVLGSTLAEKKRYFKKCWGDWWCESCLVEEFQRRRDRKAGRYVSAPSWERDGFDCDDGPDPDRARDDTWDREMREKELHNA